LLITFSGLDGAGKSTLIEWLQRQLEGENRRVAVLHMNDHIGVYAYLRFVRDAVMGLTPGRRNGQPPTGSGRSWSQRPNGALRRVRDAVVWNKPLRRFIYPVDLLLFLCYRLYVEKVERRVLIMDRYFYDTLVDVSDGRGWFWIRLLKWLTPTPHVPIYLDITPEESFARKGEYTVEYLRRRLVAYRTVFPWVSTAITLENRDLDASKAVLHQLVRQRMAGS
jgi:thymidylate kinase